MYTYADVIAEVRRRNGKTMKTCWIASVKRKNIAILKVSYKPSSKNPKHPCPRAYIGIIEKVMKDFGWL
jgi:hypothetical protein